jgi:hypothetical protein
MKVIFFLNWNTPSNEVVEWWKWRCRLLRWCWEEEEEEEWDSGMCWRARKSGKRE